MSAQETTEIALLKEALRIERERGTGWRDKFNADTDIIAELREKCAKIADEAVLNAERTKDEYPRQSIEWCCAAEAAKTARYIAAAIRAPVETQSHD